MKIGFRVPSLKKRLAAKTSLKRYVRHSLGVKMPKGGGIISDPKRATYNWMYRRTTFGVEDLTKSKRQKKVKADVGHSSASMVARPMSALRWLLCFVVPPLAVIDKGIGRFFLVTFLTLLLWVPGVIAAIRICRR